VDNKFSEIGTSCKDFRVDGELGRGSYGTVFKVVSLKDKKVYVMKKINMKHMKLKNQQNALKEVQILKNLMHIHVIQYYTSFLEDDNLHIIMEYAEKGDLYTVRSLLSLAFERVEVAKEVFF